MNNIIKRIESNNAIKLFDIIKTNGSSISPEVELRTLLSKGIIGQFKDEDIKVYEENKKHLNVLDPSEQVLLVQMMFDYITKFNIYSNKEKIEELINDDFIVDDKEINKVNCELNLRGILNKIYLAEPLSEMEQLICYNYFLYKYEEDNKLEKSLYGSGDFNEAEEELLNRHAKLYEY